MKKKTSLPVSHGRIDSFGTTVSIACAIHCTVFPLIISVLPLVGLGFLAGDGVEKVFLGTSIVLAAGSFTWGFRYHRQIYVFLFLISGLGLVLAGRLWAQERLELPLVVSGAMLLAGGHLINRRLCRLCDNCKVAYEKPAA
jgi:MerC mercury resistance protein